ncbi:DUF4865 family protein [Erwinia tasmaniensis]|uniref:DUF4865 domain-containing protein n=1 Tax=Erwinia tasmaniensis (strain DSM 17950 / CFBP 7177 / CIP 109463 / NCPPB 4357 / Et1/99) TaxID=465817 RepID=B2VD62_ERWT9|nr:DUF4865 family protein [Erwinia tasmaniensis]CAO95850.1 Conserved hypothetical protein [Erwinia tasmaniensis Et1/99]
MIAMQYRFRLPVDYDMSIITTRILENGHQFDNVPGLLLKVWCYSESNDPFCTDEPLYAPFYLWQDCSSMASFLTGGGFRRLMQDFGRPAIDSWLVQDFQPAAELVQSVFARRIITPVLPKADLAQCRHASETVAESTTQIVAWDVQRWRQLNFQLSPQPFTDDDSAERYRVGHLSISHHMTP